MEEIYDSLTWGNYYTSVYHVTKDKNISSYDPKDASEAKTGRMDAFIKKNKDTKLYAKSIYYFDHRSKKGDKSEMVLEVAFGNQTFYMVIYAHRNGSRESQKRNIVGDSKTVRLPIERTELEYQLETIGWKD